MEGHGLIWGAGPNWQQAPPAGTSLAPSLASTGERGKVP